MHKNLCYPASIENIVGKISNRLRWINGANQRRRRVNVVNPIEPNAKEAIAARIVLTGADIQLRRI